MDLALDQLAIKDRNFDRFALVLIDNVVELTLHKHAQEKAAGNKMWDQSGNPTHDPKAVASAMGQYFESKVKLAKITGMLNEQTSESVSYLHAFRNAAYHSGLRREAILHSLALFYFQIACSVLASFSPMWWSYGGRDRISHRAMKYLGNPKGLNGPELLAAACSRLREVGASMKDTLVPDLHADMRASIETTDEQIKFLSENSPTRIPREKVLAEMQAWSLAFTDKGKAYAKKHNASGHYVDWLAEHYPWTIKGDPIESWVRRLESLESEKDPHMALKKYCDFMKQTEDVRGIVEESAAQLDAHIESQIDRMREEVPR